MQQASKVNIPIKARLSGFYFFYFAVVGAFMPYWSLYLEGRGFNKEQIGWLAAITVISRIIAPSVWGYCADRSGLRMRWVRLGIVAELIAWIAILFIPHTMFWLILVLFFYSFFQNAILAQYEAVTLFYLGKQRDQYGIIRLWGSLGFIAAVLGLGWWFKWHVITTLPIVMIVLAIIAVINAWIIAEPPQAAPKTEHPSSLIPVFKKPMVWGFLVIHFLLLLSHAPFYSFYSNYLKAYGYSTSTIGLLWSVGVFAEVLMFTQSAKVLAYLNGRSAIAICLSLTSFRWVLVAAFPTFLSIQLLAQSVHAFSFALFQSIAMRLIFSEFKADQQGRAQALYSMLWGLGVAIGSILAGQVWDRFGGQWVFAMASAIVLSGLLGIRNIPKKML
ncbi:MFS transporter [Aquirhabdus parva]|uniref:MFS transporter n=1 Tax=Aquirhabdus parva TaxID=2283318 RepID=UPI001AE78BF6|nr:MFS transporter [Aquirhabdus parva]